MSVENVLGIVTETAGGCREVDVLEMKVEMVAPWWISEREAAAKLVGKSAATNAVLGRLR
jgi:hypothetical protein